MSVASVANQNSSAVSAVSAADRDKAIAVITLAFASDPMMRWSFTDPANYLVIAGDLIRAFGGAAFEHNAADQTGDFAAVALWLPPGIEPDHKTMDAIFEANMQPDRMQDGGKVMEQMGAFHPKEAHWYLPFIATDPTQQGKGFGSALLKYALARCDRDALPAYLESSNPANIPLYERFGFKVLGKIQSGSSPVLTPMLRAAR